MRRPRLEQTVSTPIEGSAAKAEHASRRSGGRRPSEPPTAGEVGSSADQDRGKERQRVHRRGVIGPRPSRPRQGLTPAAGIITGGDGDRGGLSRAAFAKRRAPRRRVTSTRQPRRFMSRAAKPRRRRSNRVGRVESSHKGPTG
ncbi:hypothetical protein NL676_013765 [Syzygium grande]|nr:hypothetical protein NL676_013765 [Syzygium grande]